MPFLAPVLGALGGSAFIGKLLLGTALMIGGTLLSNALKPPAQPLAEQRDPGVALTMQIGGNNPLSFIVGTAATAGHRTYAGSWGQIGDTPNAYYADVLELANAPITALTGLYAEGERCTILWAEPHADFGYPIQQARRDGIDYLWVKVYTGDQTVADPYLRAKFGGHSSRPYTADMIGYGTAYAVVTQRYNRDQWQGRTPSLLFEVNGLKLYDIRKDSTAGGSGAHRRNNPATWEFTRNPYVIAYNVAFMGVYVGTEWMWGLQGLPEARLPRSAWIAAMNESDREMTEWGDAPQFQIGAEVTVDMQPADFLDQVAKSSLGRFIETAGSYKPRCGLPGAAVWAFTEGQLSISDPRVFTPFPGLEATHNTIRPTYTEPGEAWRTKPAPDATDAAMIVADGNRELVTGLSFPYVTENEQVQRLAYSYLHDGRRFRTLQATFHPLAWLLEPGDVIDGTLVNEGYVDKSFEILEMSGRRTFVQTLTLREVDPADFDPPASAHQDWTVGPIETIYPPAQEVTGFQAFPDSFDDEDGTPRRPTIRIVYDGNKDDINAIHVIVRLKLSGVVVFEAEIPYAQPYSVKLNGVFLPATLYEVAIKYVPFTARETVFTEYQDVLTDDIKMVPGKDFDPFDGLVGWDDLEDDLQGYETWAGLAVRDLIEEQQANAVLTGGQELANAMQFNEMRRDIATTVGALSATFEETITVAVLPMAGRMVALADAITALSAADGGDINTARFRMTTLTGPAGYSRIGGEVRFDPEDEEDWDGRLAAFYIDAPNNPLLPSRFLVRADQFIFVLDAEGEEFEAPFAVDSEGLRANFARLGTITAGILQGTNVLINLNTGFFSFGV
jgi:hypothetical protein